MKSIFHSRYFRFILIYLCIISTVGLSLSFSRYVSGDTKTESARTAVYDIGIYSGDEQSREQSVTMSVLATSKISETNSMLEGTYEKKEINVYNFSECDVTLDAEILIGSNVLYEKLVIPMDEKEMEEYETGCGSIPAVILDRLENNVNVLKNLSDAELSTALSDAAKVRTYITEANGEAFKEIKSENLDPGKHLTFFVISWVEHDNVYKTDADKNTDNISHKTLANLNKETESFTVRVSSNQTD